MGCGGSNSNTVSRDQVTRIQEKSGGQISEKEIVQWHKIWKKITPNGKMTENQFAHFIVDNKIGTGKEIDARNMFKMMDKDKNGVMEFDEFVLILVLPKSAEEITTEQFATLCMTIYDENGDGFIEKSELLKFALAKAKAEGRTTQDHRERVTDIVNKLVAYIDMNSDGQISKEELMRAIDKDPSLKKVL